MFSRTEYKARFNDMNIARYHSQCLKRKEKSSFYCIIQVEKKKEIKKRKRIASTGFDSVT